MTTVQMLALSETDFQAVFGAFSSEDQKTMAATSREQFRRMRLLVDQAEKQVIAKNDALLVQCMMRFAYVHGYIKDDAAESTEQT